MYHTLFFSTVSCDNRELSGDCDNWASRGLCRDNRDYMLTNCPSTCKLCGEEIIFVPNGEFLAITVECHI